MRILLLFFTLCINLPLLAACPDYLDHTLRRLHSKETVNLCESFAGQPMLIVNTASFCGFTPQFEGLEALHQQYAERGLVVVGFASDDFRQEARDEAEAANVCYKNYGVTFSMIAPTHVKGDDANPVFKQLNRATQAPNWNFNKYLIDADGAVVEHFGSSVRPDSAKLRDAIDGIL
jgi:glutathione peroxidase